MQKPFHRREFRPLFAVQPHFFLYKEGCFVGKPKPQHRMSEKKEEQTVSVEMTNMQEHTPAPDSEDTPYVKGDM